MRKPVYAICKQQRRRSAFIRGHLLDYISQKGARILNFYTSKNNMMFEIVMNCLYNYMRYHNRFLRSIFSKEKCIIEILLVLSLGIHSCWSVFAVHLMKVGSLAIPIKCAAKTLIRLDKCPGWSEFSECTSHFVGFVMLRLINVIEPLNLKLKNWSSG